MNTRKTIKGDKAQTSQHERASVAGEAPDLASGHTPLPIHIALQDAITEDWELVKDTAGKACDAKTIFELAFRFGWHAGSKYCAAAVLGRVDK